jgi:dephospho-CoA kinase
MVIGITGPSGAGKGTVSKMLKARGFHHIDTDLLAREVIPETLPRLVETFGEILNEDGTLDRKALAKKAFSSAENTEKLNMLVSQADKLCEDIFDLKQQIAEAKNSQVCTHCASIYKKDEEFCPYCTEHKVVASTKPKKEDDPQIEE